MSNDTKGITFNFKTGRATQDKHSGQNIMKTLSESPRTRELANGKSSLSLLRGKKTFKKVHLNGETIAMLWYVNGLPIIGTNYYSVDKMPNLIAKNTIKLNKIVGEKTIEVVDITGKTVQQLDPYLFNTKASIMECLKQWGNSYKLVCTDYSKCVSKAVLL